MELTDIIPGYKAALDKERRVREMAFLPVTDYVFNGIPLAPLTLEKFLILEHTGNAFVTGAQIRPADIGFFIWICSPWFVAARPTGPLAALEEWLTVRRKHRVYRATARLKVVVTVDMIQRYLDEAFMDLPKGSDSVSGPEVASFVSFLVDVFGAEYGWTRPDVLQSPLPALAQALRRIMLRKDPSKIFFNPSDKIRGEFIKSLNQPVETAPEVPC